MKKTRSEDGTWRDGKAAPKLLREDLRKLPSSYLTDDISEDSKVHELDAPHIVESLVEDQVRAERAVDPTVRKKLSRLIEDVPPGQIKPLLQRRVDWVRLRVLSAMLGRMLAAGQFDPSVKHLWFPEDNINEYFLRDGNPPSDSGRPKHLRGLDLVIDPMCPPPKLVDAAAEVGVDIKYDLRT